MTNKPKELTDKERKEKSRTNIVLIKERQFNEKVDKLNKIKNYLKNIKSNEAILIKLEHIEASLTELNKTIIN